MNKQLAALLASSLLILACDGPTDVPAPKTAEPDSTVLDHQTRALENARQVEGQMQQDATTQEKQMEQATQ